MQSGSRLRWVIGVMLAAATVCPQRAEAQTPARFYWKTLSGANAVPVLVNSISGNTNPFDPAHVVVSTDAKLDATTALAGYAHMFTIFDRSAMGAFLAPMGRISGTATVGGRTFNQAANGFGDPMFEFVLNVIGPRAQKNIPDSLRYEPGFSVDVLADLALPIGKYDDTQPLNLGQNRWYGRLGAPILVQLGPWVPGRRSTLELLPAVWLFGANDDYVGQRLETDPMFQLDAHLTRDFTEHLWGSFDSAWYTGGRASVSGVTGEKLNNFGFGFTFGYTINDNLGVTLGYKSTVDDFAPENLRMDNFTVSLVYGWHPLIEGTKRLKGGS
jgi:outer membrane putative beta-barrel porin/alpha-amylase